MDQKLKQIFDFTKTTPWKDDTPDEVIIEIANSYVKNLSKDYTKKKLFHRFCGQSASGKTTQLTASVLKTYELIGEKPYLLAIRNFATLHPKYEEFKQKFKEGYLREKTNGFALKTAYAVLQKLIENGCLIIMEVTALDLKLENFVCDLLKQHNYKVVFHLLAVNKNISDEFAKLRQINGSFEGKRILYKSSSKYFWGRLKKGIRFFIQNFSNSNCVVWNAFDCHPVFFGKLENCYQTFTLNQKLLKPFEFTPEVLKQSKIDFYKSKIKELF